MPQQFLPDGVIGRPLDTDVDVLGVLPVDHNIKIFWPLVGAGGAAVVAAWANTGVEVKDLTQRNIQ